MESKSTYSWPKSKQLSSASNILIILLVFVLHSPTIYSQYFDIGESNSSPSALKGADCTLPSHWEGNWFQSGVFNIISINRSAISIKGQCIEADGDKFLFYSPTDKCFRCVVFHEKHSNVLQYKETYCHYSRGSLPSTCSTIVADYPLFSMFRLDGVPVECPFRGSFTLAYNRGHGHCEFPVSTLDSCLDSTRLVLNYQACPNVPGTESTTEELECLATWRESSSRYLLGLIRYHYSASYEERFRCFAYEKVNKYGKRLIETANRNGSNAIDGTATEENIIFQVAESGDATCLGLAPTEGSKTLVLRKAIQTQSCQFPAWLLKHTEWHTLNQRLVYIFEGNTLRISNYSSPSSYEDNDKEEEEGFGTDTLLTQAICTQIIQHHHHYNNNEQQQQQQSSSSIIGTTENLTDKVTLVLHSTSECSTGYICMAIYKREDDIIELQTGELSRTVESACHQSKFDPNKLPFSTLTASTPKSRECPILTNFDISSLSFSHKMGTTSSLTNCQNFNNNNNNNEDEATTLLSPFGLFSMGCTNMDEIELNSNNKCSTEKIAEKYTCHGWWEESGQNYLVVTSITNSSSSNDPSNQKKTQRFCFVFHETTTIHDDDSPHLSLLLQTSSRRKVKEINQQQQINDDNNDDDGEVIEEEEEVEEVDNNDQNSLLFDKDTQRRKNIKRQFEFRRFSESCTREDVSFSTSHFLKRKKRQQYYNSRMFEESSHNNVFDYAKRRSRDGEDLQFTASTSYYENCNGASSSKSVSQGTSINIINPAHSISTIIISILILPVLFTYHFRNS